MRGRCADGEVPNAAAFDRFRERHEGHFDPDTPRFLVPKRRVLEPFPIERGFVVR